MSVLRRLRGVAGTVAIWGGLFAAMSALVVLVIRRFGGPPPPGAGTLTDAVAEAALGWGMIGGAMGLLFAAAIMLADRRHTLGTLTTRRFALWGFTAGALVPLALNSAYVLAGRAPATSLRMGAIIASVCALIGMSVAALSLRVARRAPVHADVDPHAAVRGSSNERSG